MPGARPRRTSFDDKRVVLATGAVRGSSSNNKMVLRSTP